MKYFKNLENNEVYGYDTDQQSYVDAAIAAGWEDISGSWPPPPPPPEPAPIPSINAAQIRLQLNAMGLRDAVEAAVAAGSQDLKDKWQYSPRFVVTDPDIQAMATALGVTSEQLDQLFIDASNL